MEDKAGIPLTVVGGFLGSGKTTLINRILAMQSGLRIAVLVNDFGSINIDAHLISSGGGDAIALTNGCVCCSIGDDLTDTLIRVVEADPKPDWIVIEASGVSDPQRIAQVGLADPALLLDGVVVLVDVDNVQIDAADPRLNDSILRQLKIADILILNKIDLVTRAQKESVKYWLSTQNHDAWICEASDAEVPFEVLSGLAIYDSSKRSQTPLINPKALFTELDDDAHNGHKHSNTFSTWTFQTKKIINARCLRDLLEDMPNRVIRAKGIVRIDTAPEKETILQYAGNSRLLRTSEKNWNNKVSQIVFITPHSDATLAEIKTQITSQLYEA